MQKRVNASIVYCTGGLASWSHEERIFGAFSHATKTAIPGAIDRYLELGAYGAMHPSDPAT